MTSKGSRQQKPKSTNPAVWFSLLCQMTGYGGLVFVMVFWALTGRVAIEVIGAATTLLVYDGGRTALRTLAEGRSQ